MDSEQQHGWPLPTEDLKPALELAMAVSHGDMGVLMLHDDTIGALLPVLGVNLNSDHIAAIGPHRPGVGPFGRALSTHRRVTVRDACRDPQALPDLAHRLGYRGIDIVPLFGADDDAIGAIAVMFRRDRVTHPGGQRLVDHCARLVVSAVLQARRCTVANHARDTAEQIGRAKVQFLARMSHELRTPLQSIAGYLDLLRVDTADPLTPSQARHVERMRASEQILVHVIDDLITFSQIESGHVTYHLVATRAGDALRVAEAVVGPLAIDRGVRLEVVPVPNGIIVSGDADKLKQVLVNLAANAVKFTQRGGVVTLACRLDSSTVYFDVVDTGPGIAADQLAGIFEPYVQLGTPMLDHFGGSGLGLAISRDFALGMQGELTVRSVIGTGSVFTLRLPRLSSDSAAVVARPRAPTGLQSSDIVQESST
jgi:signal transduction histidine kinase